MSAPKLLCVDDEAFIVQSLERSFKSHFHVLTSTSPLSALDLLKEHPDCAVVLSDFRMPEMNGVEFLKQVRILAPLSSRAILSGQIDLLQISEAINHADIHKFILKPWENDYLMVQMLSALQLHHTLSERAHFQRLAVTDPVTELTNHRFFQDQLRTEMKKAQSTGHPLSLVMFDVDHFKSFNDRFGHPEGDRVLFTIARELKSATHGRGYVSRYGGEEFTLLLPNTSKSEALNLTEEIREAFAQNAFAGPSSSPIAITMSAGLACYPEHATEPADLIETADRALYQAKSQGRNQVVLAKRK